jgi:hypothetical protein
MRRVVVGHRSRDRDDPRGDRHRGRAYRAGEDAGITQGIEQVQAAQETGQEVLVVHVVGDGPRGFFPGLFLFPVV